MFTHKHGALGPTDHNEIWMNLWTLSCRPLIESPSSLPSPTEAVLGDRSRVSVSAHFECQSTARRVPEGRRAQPLPIRHPAGHSAGHPVRLWYSQSCQATCHCDNQRKQQLKPKDISDAPKIDLISKFSLISVNATFCSPISQCERSHTFLKLGEYVKKYIYISIYIMQNYGAIRSLFI